MTYSLKRCFNFDGGKSSIPRAVLNYFLFRRMKSLEILAAGFGLAVLAGIALQTTSVFHLRGLLREWHLTFSELKLAQ